MIRRRHVRAFAMAATAVVTIMAVSAGFAQAQGKLTSDGPVTLIGTETEGRGIKTRGENSWTAFGLTTECDGRDYVAHKLNATPHGLIASGSTDITLSPRFNVTCYTNQADPTVETTHTQISVTPVSVTMNGCDYALHIGGTTGGANTYGVTTDIVCPVGKAIEYHIQGVKTCTYSYGSQTGIAGAHLTETGTGTFAMVGTFEGFHFTGSGGLFCAAGTFNAAKQHVDVAFSGINEGGGSTSVAISD
jgi:hypothetical protein